MSRSGSPRATLLRLMLFVGLVIVSVMPMHSWASAQAAPGPLWVVRALDTSEYGIQEPQGLAFSSLANSLLILDGSASITLVSMGEESAGTWVLPDVPEDALNAVFDSRTGSLFMLNSRKSELSKVAADASSPTTRFALEAYRLNDPQGIALDADGRLFILDASTAVDHSGGATRYAWLRCRAGHALESSSTNFT